MASCSGQAERGWVSLRCRTGWGEDGFLMAVGGRNENQPHLLLGQEHQEVLSHQLYQVHPRWKEKTEVVTGVLLEES